MSGIKDEETFGRVRWALEKDAKIAADTIRLQVENGTVRMWGEVDSAAEKVRAGRIARAQSGVRDVENNLTVTMSTPRLDERKEIALAVEKALEGVRGPTALDLGVRSLQRGIVRLAGHVQSFADEKRAVQAVSAVPGVREVVSEIVIGEVPSSEAVGVFDDPALKGLVSQAISHGGVTINDERTVVDQGIAYLRGRVLAEGQSRRAEELATHVPGISDVVNELILDHRVTSADRNEALAARVTAAFHQDGRISPADVHVEAVRGDVYLFGYVDSIDDLNLAARIARGVSGARAVFNDIVLRDRTSLGSDEMPEGQAREAT